VRNLLALIGLLVVGVGGLGWYMGWYKLSFTRTSDGNIEIKTDVDTKKVTTDGSNLLKNISSTVENKANQAAKDASAAPPAGTPGATPGPVAPAQGSSLNPLAPAPAAVVPAVPPPEIPAPPPGGAIQLIPPKP
jgi:hypothetical protein